MSLWHRTTNHESGMSHPLALTSVVTLLLWKRKVLDQKH